MFRRYKYFPIALIVSLLFLKDVALAIAWNDNPLYWMENVEESDQKADTKEKEDKKDIDDKKFTTESHSFISNHLSIVALHIIHEHIYASPSFDVVSPPPERA